MSKSVEREEFEAFVSAPPFEYGLEIQPENGAWPGNYRSIAVQLAWEAWQARGASLSIQQEADAKDGLVLIPRELAENFIRMDIVPRHKRILAEALATPTDSEDKT